MTLSRRSLLRSGLAIPLAGGLPSLFQRALFAAEPGDSVLVLLQFQGGNDGLNTVIPWSDPAYRRNRPGIGIPDTQVVRLDERVGLNPALGALRAVWDQGGLAVVQGVGYPTPNRSHFASTDIWQTASLTAPQRWTGWLGRALDRLPAGEVAGLQLDPGPLSLALIGERAVVPAVRDAEQFRVPGGEAALLAALAEGGEGSETLQFVRATAREAYRTAGKLEAAVSDHRGLDAYPRTDLGRRLWQIARLTQSGFGARVYSAVLSGFDTHARQRQPHDTLLKTAADAIAAFFQDLKSSGLDRRVLLMTYSEFGRRVAENRSLGTDHGAAAPLFLVGGGVRGGVHGAHPSLTDLEEGDLRFHTDFRSVYATVLARWLRADPAQILRGDFPRLPVL